MGKGVALWLLKALLLLSVFQLQNAKKQKRQIFREQVLPSRGGKIPEEAFRADRLALNRLNKEGISIPDGVLLDARHVHKHPDYPSKMSEVLKVFLTPEGRYVPPEGRYTYEGPKTIDTTYLVQNPVQDKGESVKYGAGYNSLSLPEPSRAQMFRPLPVQLIIPRTREEEFVPKSYYPSWGPGYAWRIIYEPNFVDYFINSVEVFNSRQQVCNFG